MKKRQLDHLVLTVNNIQTSIDFYTRILGMQLSNFANNRQALTFGSQKINIEEGPVLRTGSTGSTGQLTSIYIRDPDGNLIELSNLI